MLNIYIAPISTVTNIESSPPYFLIN